MLSRKPKKVLPHPAKAPEPRVVEAVGVIAYSMNNPDLAKRVEQAMSQAVQDAIDDGVSLKDSPAIKARMLAARARVRREAGLPED